MVKCYKVRSISFPARGQVQGIIAISEELKRLKSWLASSPLEAETVGSGLEGLNRLYGSLKQILQTLSNSQHAKWVSEMIEGSIVHIDICSKAREGISQMRECVTELQSALRRKKGNEVDIETHVDSYILLRKIMKKDMERSLTELKQLENIVGLGSSIPKNHLLDTVQVLREASVATSLMFQKLLLYLSMPVIKPKPSRWSLAKLMPKGAAQEYNKNEFEGVDVEVMNLRISNSAQVSEDDHAVNSALVKLESLDLSLKGFENGLENLFKHLICMRVTYLNLSSQYIVVN